MISLSPNLKPISSILPDYTIVQDRLLQLNQKVSTLAQEKFNILSLIRYKTVPIPELKKMAADKNLPDFLLVSVVEQLKKLSGEIEGHTQKLNEVNTQLVPLEGEFCDLKKQYLSEVSTKYDKLYRDYQCLKVEENKVANDIAGMQKDVETALAADNFDQLIPLKVSLGILVKEEETLREKLKTLNDEMSELLEIQTFSARQALPVKKVNQEQYEKLCGLNIPFKIDNSVQKWEVGKLSVKPTQNVSLRYIMVQTNNKDGLIYVLVAIPGFSLQDPNNLEFLLEKNIRWHSLGSDGKLYQSPY